MTYKFEVGEVVQVEIAGGLIPLAIKQRLVFKLTRPVYLVKFSNGTEVYRFEEVLVTSDDLVPEITTSES